MKKILVVIGTRPEAIKMAPLILRLLAEKEWCSVRICLSAQHREMLDQAIQLFDIRPDYDLNIMKENQTLFDVTSNILLGLKDVLESFNPHLVLVHGDTTTTFAASLASYYLKIPVGHVEAGLRTGDIYSPFPEEINRKITGTIAKYHFSPTVTSKQNLLREGIKEDHIYITGNTVIDALLLMNNKIQGSEELKSKLVSEISMNGYQIGQRRMILVTGHRRENFGDGFLNICKALKEIADNNPDVDILYPVHLNPNVKDVVLKELSGIKNIYLIKPLNYAPFLFLLTKCYLVLTDSGGVQEEAPSLGKPVLVMRDTTERPEAVDAGCVKLVGTDKNKIVLEVQRLLNNVAEYNKMSEVQNPYGDGHASEKIVKIIKEVI